jgi:DNA-binding response OmpR family regulator
MLGIFAGTMKVLWIDSDTSLVDSYQTKLSHCLVIDAASTWAEAEVLCFSYSYDIILIDWSLPDGDAPELCHFFRKEAISVPIILLKHPVSDRDIATALEAGANDVIRKPFLPQELALRLHLCANVKTTEPDSSTHTLSHGPLTLNLHTSQVFFKENVVRLKHKEQLILETLLRNSGRVVARQTLFEKVWDQYCSYLMNTLDVHVGRLRKKIDKTFGVKMIHTVHGQGYRLLWEGEPVTPPASNS